MRYLAAAVGALALLTFAPAAQAQTWGQPVYLNSWGRPVGGTPLSEVETRAYVETGRWADGYSERPHVYIPGQAYGYRDRYERDGRGYSHRERAYVRGYWSDSRVVYRDEWGYQDDRPPSTASRRYDSRSYRRRGDCGCGDVYLYDR